MELLFEFTKFFRRKTNIKIKYTNKGEPKVKKELKIKKILTEETFIFKYSARREQGPKA